MRGPECACHCALILDLQPLSEVLVSLRVFVISSLATKKRIGRIVTGVIQLWSNLLACGSAVTPSARLHLRWSRVDAFTWVCVVGVTATALALGAVFFTVEADEDALQQALAEGRTASEPGGDRAHRG